MVIHFKTIFADVLGTGQRCGLSPRTIKNTALKTGKASEAARQDSLGQYTKELKLENHLNTRGRGMAAQEDQGVGTGRSDKVREAQREARRAEQYFQRNRQVDRSRGMDHNILFPGEEAYVQTLLLRNLQSRPG